jgi:hypothetical protein
MGITDSMEIQDDGDIETLTDFHDFIHLGEIIIHDIFLRVGETNEIET